MCYNHTAITLEAGPICQVLGQRTAKQQHNTLLSLAVQEIADTPNTLTPAYTKVTPFD